MFLEPKLSPKIIIYTMHKPIYLNPWINVYIYVIPSKLLINFFPL